MSAHSGTDSGASLEATLATMLQRLDAIEAKLEPLVPLQVHVETIEKMLHAHEQQHQELSTTVTRLETAQHELRAAHQPPDRRRSGADDDAAKGGDVMPTTHN
jgi:chromosome segregation ATPase